MFGFIKEGAKKAGKKMYGYGQAASRGARNPEAWKKAATPGVIAGGLGVGGLIAAHEVNKLPEKKSNRAGSENAKVFKAHTEAWLRLTEFPGAFDKRRWNWKQTTDTFMQDPAYVEFLKAQTIEDKYNIIKDRLHPAFDGSNPQEIMSTISDRLRK